MKTAIVLFTRDLRVRDQPVLATACSVAEYVVPLFVLDDGILGSGHAAPNRLRFLLEALGDLRASLRERGGDLVVRRGDPVTEVLRLAAETRAEGVILSADVSAYAGRRERRLEQACERHRLHFRRAPGITVVPPGELEPTTGGHYRVFTPYWRAWRAAARRRLSEAPDAVRLPEGIDCGTLPELSDLTRGRLSPDVVPGGEGAGRSRLEAWLRDDLHHYDGHHDDLPGDRTSRLSPYLHFGCLSPREVAGRAADREGAQEGAQGGAEPFLRQLAWRDFYHQVTAVFPEISHCDYRSHGDRWREDAEALQAWKDGLTGYPIVDAGMRQLAREGWMHNRARLVVASFLTKNLYIDWRRGGQHFLDLLLDGDIANNFGNWQWVASTGNDTRPYRVLSPARQARRFDSEGQYVRRYVPELAEVGGWDVHEPWKLDRRARKALDYPQPIVDPDEKPAFTRARAAD